MDLFEELPTMSWRRFQVLVRGLSPNSATVSKVSSTRTFGERRDTNVIRGPKAAQAAIEAMFGGQRKRGPAAS